MTACSRCGEENAGRARFCWNCGNQLTPSATAEVRKVVTVMFMDVVGSTELGERTDPESMRTVMTRYFDEISAIVNRHGGTVEKYIGDAVMAVFGVPVVHEDDAERAVRAALAIRTRLTSLAHELARDRGVSLRWRTGINTGEVVAGDAGSGQRFVSGDAVNVAARLQQAAQPDEVLIGQATHDLVVGAVLVETAGAVSVKGKTEALAAYRVLDTSSDGDASGHRSRHLEGPMVGRERHRRLLIDAYEQVVADQRGQLFTLLGPAGVGKSRLMREFADGVVEHARVLRGRCLSYGDGITYWPIAEIVRQAASMSAGSSDIDLRQSLASLIDDERDRDQAAQVLGQLAGQLEGTAGRDETFWAVRTLLESLARQQPVVMVIDDLQWGEPTLFDLIDYLADWLTDAPVLLIALARRELLDVRPGWGGGRSNFATVTLEPLGPDDSRQLVTSLLGDAGVGGHIAERIVDAAEGNPLYVEEMFEMLIDRGLLVRQNGSWAAAGDLSDVSVPPTIQALLAARIDGLEHDERLVLERASIEGKVFHRSAVADLAPDDLRAAVRDRLLALTRKELVRPDTSDRSHSARDEMFQFRHLLIRDTAYSAIPKTLRAELHMRFAEWLRRDATDALPESNEIVGHHYERAFAYRSELGLSDDETARLGRLAAEHLGGAGQRALDRGDVAAARKLLGSAIGALATGDALRTRLTADFAIALRTAGDIEQGERVAVAGVEDAAVAGDEGGRAHLQVVATALQGMLGRLTVSSTIGETQRLLVTLRRLGDDRAIDRATLEVASGQFIAGHAALAERILSERIAERGQVGHAGDFSEWLAFVLLAGPTPVAEARTRLEVVMSSDPSRALQAFVRVALGLLRAYEGEFGEGRDMIRDGEAVMNGMGRGVVAAAEAGSSLLHLELLAGNPGEAVRLGTAALQTLTAAGETGYAATIAGMLGEAHFLDGQLERAEHFARLASDLTTPDDFDAQVRNRRVLARVLAARGQVARATELADEAIAMIEPTDHLEARGAAFSDAGEVRLTAGDTRGAVDAFRKAHQSFALKGVAVEAERMSRRLLEIGNLD